MAQGLVRHAALLVLLLAPVARPLAAEIVEPAQAERAIALEDVSIAGDTVSGRLVNRGTVQLCNVQLLVRHVFHWANEYRPGERSPGRAEIRVVPGPIPPGGSVPFSYQRDGLASDAPGEFVTQVDVVRFTAVEPGLPAVGTAAPGGAAQVPSPGSGTPTACPPGG